MLQDNFMRPGVQHHLHGLERRFFPRPMINHEFVIDVGAITYVLVEAANLHEQVMLAWRRRREIAAPARRSRMHGTERGEIEWPITGRQCAKIQGFALVYVALNTRARGRSRKIQIVELLHLDAGVLAADAGRPLGVARKTLITSNAARIANVDAIV